MTDLERYLNSATRGLWGARRRALRQELTGHIEQRIQELRLGGLSVAEAERQTMRELGTPGQVARGMAGVYALPAFTRAGLGAALAAALFVVAIPSGLAQVQVFDKDPAGFAIRPPYLEVTGLADQLRRAGITVQRTDRQLRLALAGRSSLLNLVPGHHPDYGADPVIRRDGQLYLRSDALVRVLGTVLPVTLSGLTRPSLHFGRTSLPLGTSDRPFNARSLLEQRVWQDFSARVGLGSRGFLSRTWGQRFVLSGLQPNAIYAVATLWDPSFGGPLGPFVPEPTRSGARPVAFAPSIVLDSNVVLKVEQADATGRVVFNLPEQAVRFGNDPAVLKTGAALAGPVPAVLLNVNRRLDPAGGLSFTLVPAGTITVQH